MKVATLRDTGTTAVVLAHQGRPLEVLDQLLASSQFAEAEFFGVSGALAEITEVAAIQRALRETGETFDAVASLGGESFAGFPPPGGCAHPASARPRGSPRGGSGKCVGS